MVLAATTDTIIGDRDVVSIMCVIVLEEIELLTDEEEPKIWELLSL